MHSLKMRFLRTAHFIRLAAVCIILMLLYLLSTWSKEEVTLPSDSALDGIFHKERPVLNTDPGNFEPTDNIITDGPGENGQPHHLKPEQQNYADQSESEYGMNVACSDEISLDRTILDTRLRQCKSWDYPLKLPTASVIIVFHNEGWSVLMRTVHSVINRSPKNLLKEVLLVDDFSDKENLQADLDKYIDRFEGKVRLIRNTQREGLIRTRSRSAKEAIGEVIVFLDAHCEVNKNWLPPLLAPIHYDSRTMTVPIIDQIDHKTFEYRSVHDNNRHFRGIFEWGMIYKEVELPEEEQFIRDYKSEPYSSPTHAGGILAINRQYFLELGAYDSGLLVWGGENFELSFKIWQCGGSIEWVPCSRVGHVYRSFIPYDFGKLANKKKGPLITINYKRVIETWFDDKYKEFFYTREPLARFLDMGDISEQLAFKNKLKCDCFEWYIGNVAYDVPEKYPELPPNLHFGELRSGAVGKCLDTLGHSPPSLMAVQHCHGFGNNQLIRLNTEGQLGVGENCIVADAQGIKLTTCRLGTVDGPWLYDEGMYTLLHQVHNKCMTLHPQTSHLNLMLCENNDNIMYQQWYFNKIHPKW